MKSKTKLFVILFSCFFILSCSNLFKSQTGKGTVSLVMPYANSANSRQTLTIDKTSMLFTIKVSGNNNYIATEEAKSGEVVKFLLDEGEYTLEAIAYDSQDKLRKFPLYKGIEKTSVYSDRETEINLFMKRVAVADFRINEWGDKTKGEYEFGYGGDIDDWYPEFNKLLKKGDKATITFTGIANTDFKGTIYANFSQGFHNNTWSQIALSSEKVEFSAGDKVTLIYDLIAEEDALDITDTQFWIYYKPTDFDDELSFNEYTIDFNFEPDYKVIEHHIHVGAKTYSVYSKSGSEFVLPTYDDISRYAKYTLYNFELEGLYLNKDFTGTKYSKLSATENTKSMDFYAKLNLNLFHNDYVDSVTGKNTYNYYGDFVVTDFIEDFEVPQSGETIIYTIEGKANANFEGYMFSQVIDYSNQIWKSFVLQRNYVSIKEGEAFTLYYNQNIPENESFTSPDSVKLSLCYGYETLDNPITITDFNVKLYGGKYGQEYKPESGRSENLMLQSNENGISVTANLTINDKTVTELCFVDLNSYTEFRVNDDVLNPEKENGSTYSFVWPLCKAGEVHNIQLRWHTPENSPNEYFIYESAFCTAGGGIYEIDDSNFEKMSISLETTEDARYVVIDNFSEENCNIFSPTDDNFEYKGFEVQLYSGLKDWSDTEWIYDYNYIFGEEPEGTIYEALIESNKFNILKDYKNWKKPVELDEELSKRDFCYIGMRSYFNLKDYPDGRFFSKELFSDETKYRSYTFPSVNVNVSISYPENYTPDFIVQISTFTDKLGISTTYLNASLSVPQNDVTYYWYIDNELVASGSDNSFQIDYSKYTPKLYNAKCIATYETENGTTILEADCILTITKIVE